mmetsp:Transcript_24358/g.21509  ORF Transcript_24358/g.21509 Transcript_24358/m.21509 type:complete len:497 (+) Transcript_24358:73-1563(+)|eukprot:CAMPEP_0114585526 /NCGR_PEP_ID=MMETSP0125-20121206/9042_1 /TAXON_ID=485358 ORGANISM="Aristerostoma sp., Strain ATCC 50986" /NCGR_SAMPLE_ID=MMETSP0125 /ASSEMBLY_ACC=CAM_ASM_000245 /LENGTH=496 /DNA_ID=CAMNT_0001780637 /DNA_START=70 /DNA_END=1560 /DNA_ORIENTATION=-
MISNINKVFTNQIVSSSKQGFCNYKKQVLNLFNFQDKADANYLAATFDPTRPLQGHQVREVRNQEARYEISTLSNGIKVLTESQIFPNVVDLGILLDVGTRDETSETSGSLLSIKNTYYKTFLNTNETINYGMVQMSGGDFEMDYDQESAYFKAHCLQHDVIDIFNMMADCALEPRSATSANVAMDKAQWTHKLAEYLATGQEVSDNLLKTAFGVKGLGMPINGLKNNIGNLHANVLQKFQLENINPNKVYIVGAGIENHQEFADLCEAKLSFIPQVTGDVKQREASEYIGGEHRNQTTDNDITIALAFESVSWTHEDVFAFQVLNNLMGSSASFSTGGPGKGMHSRATTNLLNKLAYVDNANTINFNFSDTGLFGLTLGGPSSQAQEILRTLVGEIRGLAEPIPQEELQRAKNITKSNILMAMERQKDRAEEAIKNVRTFGRLTFQDYANNVDQVTGDQINNAVRKLFNKRPTLIASGGQVNTLPSLDAIQNMFN